jgi:hypothetical protein
MTFFSQPLSAIQGFAQGLLHKGRPALVEDVCAAEHALIGDRRRHYGRSAVAPFSFGPASPESKLSSQEPVWNTVGVALSGGGVRSAAFCLGALQALDVAGAMPRIDYLSTVSGGGYIGCSLTAGMSAFDGKVPFPSEIRRDERPTLQHIRDYSNYLIPHGQFDVIRSIGIYLRGLAASALAVSPWLVLAVMVTFAFNPTHDHLTRSGVLKMLWAFWVDHTKVFFDGYFKLPLYGLLAFVLGLVVWAIYRSLNSRKGAPEVPGFLPTAFAVALVAVVFLFFAGLQSVILETMFAAAKKAGTGNAIGNDQFAGWVHYLIVLLTPIAVTVGMLGNKLQWLIKTTTETSTFGKKAASLASKLAIYVAAAVVPALLWLIYIELSYWVIASAAIKASALRAAAGLFESYVDLIAFATPPYLSADARSVILLLLTVAGVLTALAFTLNANANSLHRLYRDRLSKAFLVKPLEALSEPDQEIPTLDHFKLTELDPIKSPYHLINCALNLQASKSANRRGRNADFFLFSKLFVGSEATGYVPTDMLEKQSSQIDLATAMAISGAAASSNMGSASIRGWTFSLALLNVRLGYWLRNPKQMLSSIVRRTEITPYFLYEMFGQLNENRKYVYVTDGGHIENLGVYELLRRRCSLIVVIDGEADPDLNFTSLVRLERYARIDLGIRIDIPIKEIRAANLAASKKIESRGDPGALCSKRGPHCAIGKIFYPGGEGRLLYVKASLTGDESNYVVEYKRRYSSFPHQTTGDQFFTEEQFEVYRALGFHCLHGVVGREDRVAVVRAPTDPSPGPKKPPFPGRDATEIAAVREIASVLFPDSAAVVAVAPPTDTG